MSGYSGLIQSKQTNKRKNNMRLSLNINIKVLEIFTHHKDAQEITVLNIPVYRREVMNALNEDMYTIGADATNSYFGIFKFQNNYYWPHGKTYCTSKKAFYLFNRVIYSFSSLNDGTRGSRFYLLGLKGIKRSRIAKSKGLRLSNGKSTRILDLFKTTIYFEKRSNKRSNRKLTNTFA